MRTLTLPAPAKLNLFLHVTGRRADGYHTLETLMVALDISDTVTLTDRNDDAIVRTTDLEGVPAEHDLVVRAAELLRTEAGIRKGVDIAVAKRIPQGGGMGGGSSDAATVLYGLNRLWGLGLPRAELMRIGFGLGADVPFFLCGEPAVARSAGERLTTMSLPPLWVAVVVPPVLVPTALIFAAPELTRDASSTKIDVFSEGYGRNDLQRVAVARFPQVATALALLHDRSPNARMTGSGGCVFAVFGSESPAQEAIDALPLATKGFVARTLARHPLASFG